MSTTITTDSKALREAVRVAALAISRRSSLPVLGMVRVAASGGELAVSGTDLEVAVTRTLGAEGSGAFCVAPKELLAALPKKGSVTLDVEDESVSVGGFTLRTIDADEYPTIGVQADAEYVPVSGLAAALGWAVQAAARGEARPILTGVKLGAGLAAGADNYRLHVAAYQGDLPDCVLRGPVAALLAKIAPESFEATVHKRTFGARWADTELHGGLLDGQYPNWQQIVPTTFPSVASISAPAFAAAVKAAAVVAKEAANVLRLVPDADLLRVEARADGNVASLTVPVNGTTGFVAVNAAYLGASLAGHDGTVTLSVSGPLSPLRIDHPDGRYAVLMPVRVPSYPVAAAA